MHIHWYITVVLFTVSSFVAPQTADPAANAKTKELFNYIASLFEQGYIKYCNKI